MNLALPVKRKRWPSWPQKDVNGSTAHVQGKIQTRRGQTAGELSRSFTVWKPGATPGCGARQPPTVRQESAKERSTSGGLSEILRARAHECVTAKTAFPVPFICWEKTGRPFISQTRKPKHREAVGSTQVSTRAGADTAARGRGGGGGQRANQEGGRSLAPRHLHTPFHLVLLGRSPVSSGHFREAGPRLWRAKRLTPGAA